MTLAPIVLFVYNRPWHTEQTLEALMLNQFANDSILFIYADGPKVNADESSLEKINSTRVILKKKQWCKEVHIIESEHNKGLASSIVDGVTEIVNKYGSVIVLEDDIVTSTGFLKYMNEALTFYKDVEKVMHISGYTYPHLTKLPETYFLKVPLCWGWATWKSAWQYFEQDSVKLIKYLDQTLSWEKANKFGGDFLTSQLAHNFTGNINTWFIKWHISVLMKNGLTLYPSTSLVQNIGFDNSGVHNGHSNSFYHHQLSSSIAIRTIDLVVNKIAEAEIKNFYDNQNLVTANRQSFFRRNLEQYFFPLARKTILAVLPELRRVSQNTEILNAKSCKRRVYSGTHTQVYGEHFLDDVLIGNYSYIAQNSSISFTRIGKFCSIGPNLICGWGVHPIHGISTSPMFYSTLKQNGTTFSKTDKITERKPIYIGSDVFIGMNVTILDGVSIGDGAVIGAGAIVSKDIPPYAIAVGNPIKVIRYRFNEDIIKKLLKIKWWEWEVNKLDLIEKDFENIEEFLLKNS